MLDFVRNVIISRFGGVPIETVQENYIESASVRNDYISKDKVVPLLKTTCKRAYQAASNTNFTQGWKSNSLSATEEVRGSLRYLVNRSRQLERDNPYVKRFLSKLESGIIGNGMKYKPKVRNKNGKMDSNANSLISEAWLDWGEYGVPTVDGQKDWVDCQNAVIRSMARDGEIIIRIVNGFEKNGWGFALQFLETDYLDMSWSSDLRNGNQIRMSIEYDRWDRPVFYHLFDRHPGSNTAGLSKTAVPADQIIHVYAPTRELQGRGVPWIHAGMLGLNHLGRYHESELIASVLASHKMWAYESEDGDSIVNDLVNFDSTKELTDEEINAAISSGTTSGISGNNFVNKSQPGQMFQVPKGHKIHTLDPQHPNDNFDSFTKTILRGFAASTDITYHGLSGDLEGVNFNSARTGEFDERDFFKKWHRWMNSHFHKRVSKRWLPFAILSNHLNLPISKLDKFMRGDHQGRSFPLYDPLKDAKTFEILSKLNVMSSGEIIEKLSGRDVEEVYEEIATLQKMRENLGIKDNEDPVQLTPEEEANDVEPRK